MRLPALFKRLFPGIQTKEAAFWSRDDVYYHGLLPRAHYNYARDIGDGLDSNVLMAPVMWVMRTFTEAHAIVQSKRARQIWEEKPDHEAEVLIDQPNPFYDGDALWKATIVSYILDGNGYWIKRRNAFGDVKELWYAPHWLMRPKWPTDGSEFISHYEYSPTGSGMQVILQPRDVVHFRFGLDPRNPRLGMGCLRPLMREVFTDEEAASFSATTLSNMGVPGLVVSPANNDSWTPEQTKELKNSVDESTMGEGKGGTLAFGRAVNIVQLGFDANKIMLTNLRDISEERVCALIGIPAAVVGFGSGLQSTKVGATMRELMRAAWTTCLSPMQKSMAKQLTVSLLSDFVKQPRMFRIHFDTTDVSAFQEEKSEVTTRAAALVTAGILRVDRAQEMCGLEVDPTQEVYLRPTASTSVDKSGDPISMIPEGEEPVIPGPITDRLAGAGAGNGNGKKPTDEESA